MATILKNTSAETKQWLGFELPPFTNLEVSTESSIQLSKVDQVVADIGSGELVVNDGIKDLSPVSALAHLRGDSKEVTIAQTSELGSKKIWVHESPKPEIDGRQFYAVWSGVSDDMVNRVISGGEPLIVRNQVGQPTAYKDFEFLHEYGDVYIHEAYFMWANAGIGDNFSAEIHTKPTKLQTMVNLNLVVDNHCVKFAPGGPGTGTHGFAAPPVLIKRVDFSGNWDYSAEHGLTPNMEGRGFFDIFDIGVHVNTFLNTIPVFGTTNIYNVFESNDTAWLPPGYFIRVNCNNVSNSEWTLFIVAALFRETTV